ncbi:MAG: peptidase, partial [Alphaproteobacteria bacterium]|nr:peptidase [Alphaproteobacteria bacterium]
VPIALSVNAGLSTDLLMPEGTYFDGVGLYRTELPFMTSEQLPDVETQTDIYKRAILGLNGKPIVFRTLDIGSDKILPYFENTGEKNPAMGWRSIRITLDRRALLRGQLRAFIRAAEGKELRIMFPMISSINEFLEAKKTLQIELERERQKGGILPSAVKVGTMLEVPSLMFQLNELVKLVDFVSIGTNDLAQFLFATDRGNPMIWDRYDSLSPAMLKALKYINDICKDAGIPCSICGEMASKPLEAMALVGLGFTSLSMTPAALGAIKAVVRSMNQKEVANYLKTQLSSPSATLRDKLKSYATDHDIFI